MSETLDVVDAVHIFPVKSCHEATVNGELPTELSVGPTGFEVNGVRDRQWIIVDEKNLFVSQRGWDEDHHVKTKSDKILATVKVDIRPDHVFVSAESYGSLQLGVNMESGTPSREISIFGKKFWGFDESKEAGTFYSGLLHRAVNLVRADPNRPTILPEKYQRPDAANMVAGADGRPFSLASQASLNHQLDLKGLARGAVSLDRYRASIDISGDNLGAFGEDYLRVVRIGKMVAYVVKALERCPIPNINQQTGEHDNLSNKLLWPDRYGWAVGDSQDEKAKPYMAQSLNHKWRIGQLVVVRVGDEVEPIEIAEESNVVLQIPRTKTLDVSRTIQVSQGEGAEEAAKEGLEQEAEVKMAYREAQEAASVRHARGHIITHSLAQASRRRERRQRG